MSVSEDLKLFARLCDEAVAKCGANIQEIEKEVERAIEALPEDQRLSLRKSLDGFLRNQNAMSARKRTDGTH